MNLRQYRDGLNVSKICDTAAQSLAREGERIIQEAYASKDWENRTYNLYNSYVSAVFYNGALIDGRKTVGGVKFTQSTIRFAGPEHIPDDPEATIRQVNGVVIEKGRDEAINFLKSYQRTHQGQKSLKLVIAAAMFYSGILESKGYSVLSQVTTELDELFRKGVNVPMSVAVSKWTGKNIDLLIPFDNIGVRTSEEEVRNRTFNFIE